MTKASREGYLGLLVGRERQDASATHAVTSGPDPRLAAPPVQLTATAHTSLARRNRTGPPVAPVAPKATESLLREFLDAMSALEADLARRWVGSESRTVFSRSE